MVDPETNELSHRGATVRIEPKATDVRMLLAARVADPAANDWRPAPGTPLAKTLSSFV